MQNPNRTYSMNRMSIIIRARRYAASPKSDFLLQLRLAGLPLPTHGDGCPNPELVFAPPRKWRWDWAYLLPEVQVGIEYNGIFGPRNSSHASVANLMRDYRKWTEASLRGWVIILIDAKSVETGEAVAWVERALKVGREGLCWI